MTVLAITGATGRLGGELLPGLLDSGHARSALVATGASTRAGRRAGHEGGLR